MKFIDKISNPAYGGKISNFYKVNLGQDCIPYGGIILSF